MLIFPEEFIKRINTQKYIDAENLLKALEDQSPVSIRINRSKWNQNPVTSRPVPWCKDGFYLKNRPSYTLDPLFHAGCYYPQEASGMFLEQIIRQTASAPDKLRVLDLCAAPGGKSIHLSDLIGNESLLIANDAIRSRAAILSETISKWGSQNTLVTQNDPAVFGRLSGYFDIILVDAPCSGEGMFRSEVARNEWSVSSTAHCSERQKRILMDVWPALKENGILVYSTCTFNPTENEENIKWLSSKKEAESIKLDISGFNGIHEIDFQGVFGYGFYPGKAVGEGLFFSAIRKNDSQELTKINNRRKSEFKPAKNDLAVSAKWTDFRENRLLKWGDELYAVPCGTDEFNHIYDCLKIVKAGTCVFTVKNENFLPSHELALSPALKPDAFPLNEISLTEVLRYMRRDNFILPDAPKGWNIVTYKGRNIGFVKNIGNRLNNYFPVEWRIRMNLPEAGTENIINWI